MRYIPASSVSIRAAAWRHLRVKEARRSRKVPFNRSIKAVLNCVPPYVRSNSSFAFSCVPLATLRVISTTLFFFVCLITVAIHRSGHASSSLSERTKQEAGKPLSWWAYRWAHGQEQQNGPQLQAKQGRK